jgi:hypothetical protein
MSAAKLIGELTLWQAVRFPGLLSGSYANRRQWTPRDVLGRPGIVRERPASSH